jgi:hypothetical protein
MIKKILSLVAILCVLTFAALAADVSGKWTFEQAGRQGGNPTTTTLTLKAEGGKLTGMVSRPGRGGQGTMDTQISEGTVDGNTVTFKTSQDMRGTAVVTSYKGTLDGDTLKLDITRPGFNGGEPTTTSVAAKRATT